MTTPTPPPQQGQLNWAVPLDNYVNNNAIVPAGQALGLIQTHVTAVDPHGDQAYARSLINAITASANQPNGFAQLNGAGKLPVTAVPSSALQANFYDVINDYGILPNTGADLGSALNTLLAEVGTAGGGEVWVGDGVFCSGQVLLCPSNVWLHLSPGAVIQRINPLTGSAPAQMLCNVAFTGSAIPSGQNILVSGGTWDATGNGTLTSACTPIMFVQVQFAKVEESNIMAVANSPAVEINGSRFVTLRDNYFTGASISASGALPAVRINMTSSTTTPAGLASYNNATCETVMVESCIANSSSFNRFLGTDLTQTASSDTVTVTGCAMANGVYTVTPPVDGTSITQLQAFGNQFYTEGTLDITTTGLSGAPTVFIGNSYNGGPNVAVNLAGTLSYATGVQGAVTPETWHYVGNSSQPAFATDWANFGSNAHLAFKRMPDGSVKIIGSVTFTAGAGTTIFTLPAGYTPASNQLISFTNATTNTTGYAQVTTSGAVIVSNASLVAGDQFFISGSYDLAV